MIRRISWQMKQKKRTWAINEKVINNGYRENTNRVNHPQPFSYN